MYATVISLKKIDMHIVKPKLQVIQIFNLKRKKN